MRFFEISLTPLSISEFIFQNLKDYRSVLWYQNEHESERTDSTKHHSTKILIGICELVASASIRSCLVVDCEDVADAVIVPDEV